MAIFGTMAPIIDDRDLQEAAFAPVAYNPNLANVGWYKRQERILGKRGRYDALPLSRNVVDQRHLGPTYGEDEPVQAENLDGQVLSDYVPPVPKPDLGPLPDQAGFGAIDELVSTRQMADAKDRLARGLRWEHMQPSEFQTDRDTGFFAPSGGRLNHYNPAQFYDAVGLGRPAVVASGEPRERPSLRELNPELMLAELPPMERHFGSLSPMLTPEQRAVDDAAQTAATRTRRSVQSPRTPGPITFGLGALGLTPEILARIAANTLGGAYDKFTGR